MWIYTPKARTKQAMLLATNVCLSVCMMLQGRIVIHAASVRLAGRTIGLMAYSGAGKSTLLWELLLRHGARLVTDDALPVAVGAECRVVPSRLPAKLWSSDLERLALDSDTRRAETFGDSGKYWVDVANVRSATCESSLDTLFLLEPEEPAVSLAMTVSSERVTAATKLLYLMQNLHGIWMVPAYVGRNLFPQLARLAESVPMHVLKYPKRYDALAATVDEIRACLAAGTPK